MIPCTKNFTKETLLGRLGAAKFDLKQFKELAKVETTFSALNVKSGLAKNTSAQWDIAISSKTVEEKIKEGLSLLVKREKYGKNILSVRHVMNMVIMHLNVLKEIRNIEEILDIENINIFYMLMKKKN